MNYSKKILNKSKSKNTYLYDFYRVQNLAKLNIFLEIETESITKILQRMQYLLG